MASVMGFFITEEKELPEFSNTDANKVLKVDSSGLYLQWLQETVAPAELPSQAGNAGRLLTTNGSTASWTNGPIGLGTTGPAAPMLWFGASNNGFAEAWTAGGGATGISAITNGAVCCTFQNGAVRLPGGNPIRSNGNAASRFQFTSDVPNMQNSVTAGTVGVDRTVNASSANWASNSLDLVTSFTQDTPGNLVASSMAIEVKNNQILFTGAATTASATLPTRSTRMTIDNTLVTTNMCLSAAGGLCLVTSAQATNRTLQQSENPYQRMNFSSNDVTYTLPALSSGTMFYLNPFASAGSTFGAFIARGTGVANFETYFNGVRTQTTDNVRLEAGSIYQCIYFANLTNWHIIRLGITQQVNFTGGSASVPSISFNDPPGVTGNNASGIWGSDNNIFFGTNGTQRMNINNNGIYINGANNGQQGIIDITDSASSAVNPSIKINATVGNDTGIFSNFDGRIQISSNGSEVFRCEQSTNYNYNILHVNDHLRMVNNKEIQFGTTDFGTNAIKGNYAGDSSEILFTIGGIQHVQFKKSQVNFLRNVSYAQCPLYDFTLFSNNSSEYQISINTPPVIFFSPPAANNSTNTVYFPVCANLPVGWQVRIIFHNMNNTFTNNRGRLRFGTQTVNLFATGVSSWNVDDYNELVNGTVVDVINYRRDVTADSRWYVVGVVSP